VLGLGLVALAVFRPERFAIVSLVAGGLLLALSLALAQAFAMPRLAAPSGPNAVGTVDLTLERPSDEGPRKLFLKIWYPALPRRDENEGLWRDLQAMPDVPGYMRFGLAYLGRVSTHSQLSAPFSPGEGPARIVLYNHSFVSWASENSLLAEDLASHGFTVIAVRHIGQVDEYEALDGRVKPEAAAAEMVRRRAADSLFVADRLAQVMKAIPQFAAEVPNTYSAIGFSLGGAVSTQLCVEDRRCRAVANLDGGIPGVDYAKIAVPHYLMVYGKDNIGGSAAVKAGAAGGYEERIFSAARHADFHDAAVALPVMRWFFGRSTAELERERREVAATVRDFLEQAQTLSR
jgi:dienelactone hydrolase